MLKIPGTAIAGSGVEKCIWTSFISATANMVISKINLQLNINYVLFLYLHNLKGQI